MADPVSGGIGKASKEMMQELQKQAQELAQKGTGGADKTQNFQQMMVNNTQDVQKTQQVMEVQKPSEVTKASNVLQTARADATSGVDKSLDVKTVEGAKDVKKTGFKKVLDQMMGTQNKLDDIIKMSLSGKKFSQQQLLAIQASVYKFSQELELTSKVVEKATSGVKQTMQTQV